MEEITNIVKCGKDKYSIYLENQFFCFLKSETIVKNGIKIGSFFSKSEIDKIKLEDEKLIAFDKALNYLSAIKSEKQVKDYLFTKGFNKPTVDYAISKLKEYNYLNDELFAKIFIENYKTKKGIRWLRFELEAKGISKEIIDKFLVDVAEDEDILLNLAQKYLKNKELNKKTASKLSAHLLSKGFSFASVNGTIKKIFYNLSESENESWDWCFRNKKSEKHFKIRKNFYRKRDWIF